MKIILNLFTGQRLEFYGDQWICDALKPVDLIITQKLIFQRLMILAFIFDKKLKKKLYILIIFETVVK